MITKQHKFQSRLSFDQTDVVGAMAEILSVLKRSPLYQGYLGRAVSLETLASICSDSRPPEERAGLAAKVCRDILEADPVLSWPPYFDELVQLEYAGEFYVAYRDHTIHTVQALLLGLYLLEQAPWIRSAIVRQLRAVSDTPGSDEDLLYRWWVCTIIWHDVGYVFEAESFLAKPEDSHRLTAMLVEGISNNAFRVAFKRINPSMPDATIDRWIGAGGFSAANLSAESLFGNEQLLAPLDRLWVELALQIPDIASLTSFISRLTLGGRAGRPPYHDHGIMSALLLQWSLSEAAEVVESLVESRVVRRDQNHREIVSSLTDVWGEMQLWRPIFDASSQAIVYHNIYWTALPDDATRRLPQGSSTRPGWSLRPDVTFLALVDTLQDWGRSHFKPLTASGEYRKSRTAADMLISCDDGGIHVSLRDGTKGIRADSASVTRSLFEGWLAEDVISRIMGDASFTEPEALMTDYSVEGSTVRKSARRRDELIALIDSILESVIRSLFSGEDEPLPEVARQIGNLMTEIGRFEQSSSILPDDRQAARRHLQNSRLPEVQAASYAAVRKGRLLDKGRVSEKLGEGGFGRVFLIESEGESDAHLAFKLYHQAEIDNLEKVRLFETGFRAMERLSWHDGVVGVHGFSRAPLGFYMDYVPGGDLGEQHVLAMYDSLLSRLDLIAEIAEVVKKAHDCNPPVYHRDIKPKNILIDARGYPFRAVLTDFDLAWIGGQTQTAQQALATINYGAPEQFEARWSRWRKLPQVDVYGLAALSYYVLVGEDPPFYGAWGDTHWALLERRLRDSCSGFATRRIIDLLRTATVTDPMKRMATAQSFVDGIKRCKAAVDQRDLSELDWKNEVADQYGEQRLSFPVVSKSGSAKFDIFLSSETTGVVYELTTQIQSQPLDQGGTHRTYRDRVSRSIDKACRRFHVANSSALASRRGAMDAQLRVVVQLVNMPLNLESATATAQLMRDISSAIS